MLSTLQQALTSNDLQQVKEALAGKSQQELQGILAPNSNYNTVPLHSFALRCSEQYDFKPNCDEYQILEFLLQTHVTNGIDVNMLSSSNRNSSLTGSAVACIVWEAKTALGTESRNTPGQWTPSSAGAVLMLLAAYGAKIEFAPYKFERYAATNEPSSIFTLIDQSNPSSRVASTDFLKHLMNIQQQEMLRVAWQKGSAVSQEIQHTSETTINLTVVVQQLQTQFAALTAELEKERQVNATQNEEITSLKQRVTSLEKQLVNTAQQAPEQKSDQGGHAHTFGATRVPVMFVGSAQAQGARNALRQKPPGAGEADADLPPPLPTGEPLPQPENAGSPIPTTPNPLG